tara:strand:- start:3548 stop:4195 length:648 start_codon:yes stop_codon:yes gene_type:complete
MMNIVDNLNVDIIANEVNQCPEEAWEQVREWTAPTVKRVYNLYKQGVITDADLIRRVEKVKYRQKNPDESVEQDRLHLLWQMTEDSSGLEWWDHDDWRNKQPSYNGKYIDYFPCTVNLFTEYFGDRLQRMFFSRLRPGKQLYPHSDGVWGEDFSSINRYGLVVITNNGCAITVDGIMYKPTSGTLIEFDNALIHSAINDGQHDRIVLYADVKKLD